MLAKKTLASHAPFLIAMRVLGQQRVLLVKQGDISIRPMRPARNVSPYIRIVWPAKEKSAIDVLRNSSGMELNARIAHRPAYIAQAQPPAINAKTVSIQIPSNDAQRVYKIAGSAQILQFVLNAIKDFI